MRITASAQRLHRFRITGKQTWWHRGSLAAALKPAIKQRGRLSQWRPVIGLGIISYGIYLWHEPVLLAINGQAGLVRQNPNAFLQDTAVVLTISIAAGGLSYLLIQRPTDQLLQIFGNSSRRDATASQSEAATPRAATILQPQRFNGNWSRAIPDI